MFRSSLTRAGIRGAIPILLAMGLWRNSTASQEDADFQVHPIAPPDRPLPSERETAGVTRFSFIVYGDTRSDSASAPGVVPEDGQVLQREHAKVVSAMLRTTSVLASTNAPIKFVVLSGDAVLD